MAQSKRRNAHCHRVKPEIAAQAGIEVLEMVAGAVKTPRQREIVLAEMFETEQGARMLNMVEHKLGLAIVPVGMVE